VCSIAHIWFGIKCSLRTIRYDPQSENGDWLSIAEQASKDMNPAKLMALVKQLAAPWRIARKPLNFESRALTSDGKLYLLALARLC